MAGHHPWLSPSEVAANTRRVSGRRSKGMGPARTSTANIGYHRTTSRSSADHARTPALEHRDPNEHQYGRYAEALPPKKYEDTPS